MKEMGLKELASFLTYNCVRNNTIIERIHSKGGITEEEMKTLNIQIRNNIYTYLTLLQEGKMPNIPFCKPPDYWEDAELDKTVYDALKEWRK